MLYRWNVLACAGEGAAARQGNAHQQAKYMRRIALLHNSARLCGRMAQLAADLQRRMGSRGVSGSNAWTFPLRPRSAPGGLTSKEIGVKIT